MKKTLVGNPKKTLSQNLKLKKNVEKTLKKPASWKSRNSEHGANPLSQNIFFESVPTLKIMLACFFEKNDPFVGSPGNLTMIARAVVKFYVGGYQEWLEILILDPIRCENVFLWFLAFSEDGFFWFLPMFFFWFLAMLAERKKIRIKPSERFFSD